MGTIILGFLFILDVFLFYWWLDRKLNGEERTHAYNLYVYNADGSFKRVEGIPDQFAVIERAEEAFVHGAQKIVVSENGYMKQLFTCEDYEVGLCAW